MPHYSPGTIYRGIRNNLYEVCKYVAEITALSGFVVTLVGDVATRESWSGFEYWGWVRSTGIGMCVGGMLYRIGQETAERHFGVNPPSCRLPNRTNQQSDLEAITSEPTSDLESRTD